MEVESGEWRYASLPMWRTTAHQSGQDPPFFYLLLILVPPFSPTSTGRLYGKVTRFGITICCCRTLHLGGGAEEVGRKRRKRSQAGFLPGDGVPLLWNSLCEMESMVKEGRRRRRRRRRPPAHPSASFESWDIVARIFSHFFFFFCLSACPA